MKRKGFSLVELLVVIAIIAILAAILFPVISRAKLQAKKTADSTNMKSIYQALKLYHADAGGYPPLLVQVVEYNGATQRNIDQVRRGFLFRQRVKDIATFGGELSEAKKDDTVQACWPTKDARAGGDPAEEQFKGPGDLMLYEDISPGFDPGPLNGQSPSQPAEYYAYDIYDTAPTLNPACVSADKREVRYTLFWTAMSHGGGGSTDNPRQLGYTDPKDDAVVTWNTFFQEVDSSTNIPKHTRSTLVLLLNGSVLTADGKDVFDRSWRFGQ